MRENNFIEVWRYLLMNLQRTSLREAIVVVIVSALTIGVFLGVVHVMGPDKPSQAESSQQTPAAPASPEDAVSPS